MKLCPGNFKDLDSEYKLGTIFECLQNIKCTNDTRITHTRSSTRHAWLKLRLYNINLSILKPAVGIAICFWRYCRTCRRKQSSGSPSPPPPTPSCRFGSQVKHRPLITDCRDFKDIEHIINANKLKGTIYGVNRDLPKENSFG